MNRFEHIARITARGNPEQQVSGTADQVLVRLTNPFRAGGDNHAGNRMALANIRERLQLHFDAEASLQARVEGRVYEVTLRLPYITAPR